MKNRICQNLSLQNSKCIIILFLVCLLQSIFPQYLFDAISYGTPDQTRTKYMTNFTSNFHVGRSTSIPVLLFKSRNYVIGHCRDGAMRRYALPVSLSSRNLHLLRFPLRCGGGSVRPAGATGCPTYVLDAVEARPVPKER